jgi:hypothetical protein
VWQWLGSHRARHRPANERGDHLQSQKTRLTEPSHVTPMSVSEIIALPTFPQGYSREQIMEISALEARGVSVMGYLARLRHMDDGDSHIQITQAPGGGCLDSDTRDQLITELTPGFQARKPAYSFDALRAPCGTATQLHLTGWRLYDSPHKGDSGRSTPWEVHPVTRIELCCRRELS